MISLFRSFAKSKWAVGLFALIILSFVVVGGTQTDVFGGLGPRHVISAGDRSLDAPQFRVEMERVRADVQERAGRPVAFADLVAENLHLEYLNAQTQRRGFLAWAWKAGIRPGEALVVKQIREIPAFFNQVTGQFDEEQYSTVLAQENMTTTQLERDFRDQYATQHFAAAMYAGLRTPRAYGALLATQALQARDGRWFSVTQAMAGETPPPTEAQLTAFLNENADRLRQPEYRMASVLLFNDAAGAAPAPVSEERIQERFEFRRSALSTPETRTFVTLTAPTRAAAERIAAALRAGRTPEQAGEAENLRPAEFEATPRTAVADPAVAAAVFALQPGAVSDPIQGRVGFTVAALQSVSPGQPATLEGVRAGLVEELQREDATERVFSRVQAYEAARNEGRSLNEAAAQVGARLVQLPPFTEDGRLPDGQPMNAPPQLLEAAWSLTKGGESEVIDAGQGQYFVLRLDDVRPAALPTLAEVREPLARQWIQRENARRLTARAEQLAARIRAGEDIAAVAASAGASLTARTSVQQNPQTQEALGEGVLQGLFGQGPGQVFTAPQSATSYAVGRVDAVRPPATALAAPVAERVRGRLAQELATAAVDQAVQAAARRVGASNDPALALEALGVPATAAAPAGVDARAGRSARRMSDAAFAAFAAGLTAGRPQTVVRRLVDDLETPVSAYLKVGYGRPYAFLLESVEGGALNGRYSIIALDPDVVWRCRGGAAETAQGDDVAAGRFTPEPEPALASLRRLIAATRFDLPDDADGPLPPMAAGLFGVFGYDMVRLLEPLGDPNPDPLDLPDSVLARPSLVAIFDSVRREIVMVAAVYPDAGADPATAWAAAHARLEAFEARLRRPLAQRPPSSPAPAPDFRSPVDGPAFAALVDRAKAYIAAGDIFQVVLSHRFHAPWPQTPFAFYRSLRRQNPSPYLFYLDFGGFQLAGSSPEILVRLKDGGVTIRPLAGTRARGATPEADRALEVELLADPKERAEHLMLLDLGRNDVGRVSLPGSVEVTESFVVERYSQVMHIVSNVRGRADPALDAVDTLLAALPAGTLSGAPKVRAMGIIDELEGEKRGVGYGGGVGYISAGGEADICIVLRTALFADGQVYVQAGAGVVADSDPEAEYAETLAKARAPMRAAADAWRFDPGPPEPAA